MKTILDLKFHKGQEFTKLNMRHVHCIIHAFSPSDSSYLVAYSASGNIRKITEAELENLYGYSNFAEKVDTRLKLGSRIGNACESDEDGERVHKI